jgi:Heavy-metal resistance
LPFFYRVGFQPQEVDMKKRVFLGFFAVSLILSPWHRVWARDALEPVIYEEAAQSWDDFGRELQDLFGRWRDYVLPAAPQDERSLISLMLQNREKLGLSSDQVKKLEQLKTEFQKESIRRDADARVAEMDLKSLLEAQPVDMAKVEAKIREIERSRADIRLARIRAIEKAKELLTADQRKKLQEIMGERSVTQFFPLSEQVAFTF